MSSEFDSDTVSTKDRRPLKTRSWRVFQFLATKLAAAGVTPNAISVASVAFAVLGAIGFGITGCWSEAWIVRGGWLLAIAGIQMRLIANLLDGMVAVEGGKASATGPLFNEVPDRLSDPILLVAAGYAQASDPVAGWAAAVMALLVAYVRAVAASVGAGQLFLGPMAKQQRMALLTFVAGYGMIVPSHWLHFFKRFDLSIGIVQIALWAIVGGCAITVCRRLSRAAIFLRSQERRSS